MRTLQMYLKMVLPGRYAKIGPTALSGSGDGISIAFVIHSVDRSLSIRLILQYQNPD